MSSAHLFNIFFQYPVQDKVGVAIMGLHGRGSQHIQAFAKDIMKRSPTSVM